MNNTRKAKRQPRTKKNVPLARLYGHLFKYWGPQHWWPGESPTEIIIGAILTQNTAWGNVEKAIANLKARRAVNWRVLQRTPAPRLAGWIKPAGYFNVKARRLKSFVQWLMQRYQGDLDLMFRTPTALLRAELLGVSGIGPETADSILLYAGNHPVFVVDAYTRRILERHGWMHPAASYDEIAAWFIGGLPVDVALYNEFHALMVMLGKHYCRPRPRCEACPLRRYLPRPRARPAH